MLVRWVLVWRSWRTWAFGAWRRSEEESEERCRAEQSRTGGAVEADMTSGRRKSRAQTLRPSTHAGARTRLHNTHLILLSMSTRPTGDEHEPQEPKPIRRLSEITINRIAAGEVRLRAARALQHIDTSYV